LSAEHSLSLHIKIIKQAAPYFANALLKQRRASIFSVGSGATHAAKICTTAPERINQNSFI
jgi:hypothetical protein